MHTHTHTTHRSHCSSLWSQPLDDIRDYYGEQVGMYFAYLQFYSRWLLPIALIGALFFIWQLSEGKVAVDGMSAFGLLIAIWSCVFLETWKRRQAQLTR